MQYFLDNSNPNIVVAFEKESAHVPGDYDRVVWSTSENRFIYGALNDYFYYDGDKDDEICYDDSEESQESVKKGYKRGFTHCKAVIFDNDNKLYKISDIGQEPELIFDANILLK